MKRRLITLEVGKNQTRAIDTVEPLKVKSEGHQKNCIEACIYWEIKDKCNRTYTGLFAVGTLKECRARWLAIRILDNLWERMSR